MFFKFLLPFLALFLTKLAFAGTEVSFLFCYDPDHPEVPTTRRILELSGKNPDLTPVKWGGLALPGAGGRSTFMLALSGGTAPDIYKVWFHILRHDVSQGFVYPLDEWCSPPTPAEQEASIWDKVRSIDGHVWALPTPGIAYYGIVYRKDLVRAQGLDPEKPPQTWSEFREWAQALTVPGRRAFAIENRPWGFLPWVQSAGGDVIRQNSQGQWEACFDSPEAVAAADYLQDLVRRGVVRGLSSLTLADEIGRLFASGEIVAVFGGEDLVLRLTETLEVPPEIIGLMAFPAADQFPNGRRVLQAHKHFYAMSESVARRPKNERNLVYECLQALASPEAADEDIHRQVAEGRARWCLPKDLKRLGYTAELAALPKSIRDLYDDLESGKVKAVTEPWVGFWQAASDLVQRRFLGILLSDSGRDLDCRAALESITQDANRGLMFDADKGSIIRARPYARVILGALIFCALIASFLVWRSKKKSIPSVTAQVRGPLGTRRILPWFFLLPALASVLLWSYYPLIRGAFMAFQDYRIIGSAEFVGLDNFIRVATDPGFWKSIVRTLEYVFFTLLMGFVTPIVLALALCEIPRGKVFFRFLFFLPHLTSALVVTLLWKLMFDPTENGILNRILLSCGFERQSWLQDPSLAMVCCILPGVWAGAGMASLIYIAALDSMPTEYYEAAAIDGAGIFARFRHVTFPQLAPLMIINFVGAFIAAFQGMGSIFLLTFGGPGDATQVLSLQIWKEAYNNLRFSTATTMAWFLGVALIGWTYLQIRFLRRVEFRRAGA